MLSQKRFAFLWVLGLSAGFALAIVGARFVGLHQPPPDAVAELHLTDCALPCWLHIVPEQTTLADALQQLQTAYPKFRPQVAYSQIYLPLRADARIYISLNADGIVDGILLLAPNDSRIALGDLINSVGLPTCQLGGIWGPIQVYGASDTFAFVVPIAASGTVWRQSLDHIEIHPVNKINVCAQ